MSTIRQLEIDAINLERRHTKLRVRIANIAKDWGRGTFLTLPNRQNVIVLAKGMYQAIGSGAGNVSLDPTAH